VSYYHRCIEDVDRQLARILDALEQSGQADRTIVVFTSDHGEMLGTHGLREKGLAPTERLCAYRFWCSTPDLKQGSRTPMMCSSIDIAPTLLNMAGIDSAQIADKYPMLKGRSFSDALSARSAKGPRDESGEGVLMQWNSLIYVNAQSGAKFGEVRKAEGLAAKFSKVQDLDLNGVMKKRGLMRGVSDGKYKFARYFSPDNYHTPRSLAELQLHNDLELYDLKNDPGELNNLARNIGIAEVGALVDRLLARCQQ
jgi:arylsulfatase A-like enzyme